MAEQLFTTQSTTITYDQTKEFVTFLTNGLGMALSTAQDHKWRCLGEVFASMLDPGVKPLNDGKVIRDANRLWANTNLYLMKVKAVVDKEMLEEVNKIDEILKRKLLRSLGSKPKQGSGKRGPKTKKPPRQAAASAAEVAQTPVPAPEEAVSAPTPVAGTGATNNLPRIVRVQP